MRPIAMLMIVIALAAIVSLSLLSSGYEMPGFGVSPRPIATEIDVPAAAGRPESARKVSEAPRPPAAPPDDPSPIVARPDVVGESIAPAEKLFTWRVYAVDDETDKVVEVPVR